MNIRIGDTAVCVSGIKGTVIEFTPKRVLLRLDDGKIIKKKLNQIKEVK